MKPCFRRPVVRASFECERRATFVGCASPECERRVTFVAYISMQAMSIEMKAVSIEMQAVSISMQAVSISMQAVSISMQAVSIEMQAIGGEDHDEEGRELGTRRAARPANASRGPGVDRPHRARDLPVAARGKTLVLSPIAEARGGAISGSSSCRRRSR
jgi:hypothetical protein